MGRIHYKLKKRLYRLKAFRRKGFGVHSPFTFHLIVNVIEAKLTYYAFGQLFPYRKIIANALKNKLENNEVEKSLIKKYKEEIQIVKSTEGLDRLLFRLMNFWQAKKAAYCGGGIGLSIVYMAKLDSRKEIACLDRGDVFATYSDDLFQNYMEFRNLKNFDYQEILKENPNFDFLVFSENTSSEILSDFLQNYEHLLAGKCMVVVQNPHKNDAINQFWRQMKKLERISVSLDLFYLGILISREGMQKQDYVRKHRF
ncbi:hypothetical protein BZG02_00140 [Labilibaculum filiforme]|uniref:SAM-dependent methyltransferase n=1 Tax=Labilibaculum filiforme TaxID=1940526 RepID=A0A2N3I572_9BACT|nr:hypothetical protein [Labilibaculum filiforme]PKQ65452.1 hypothetical protein BZG02_00140 [Labilibaculum filiforme]